VGKLSPVVLALVDPSRDGVDGREFPGPDTDGGVRRCLAVPAMAYYLLQKAIMRRQGAHSVLAEALGSDIKGKISPILYVAGIVLAFVSPWTSIALYVLVAVIWLVPDRRIEDAIGRE
jgi:uncharacterized membrane protein